MAALPGGYARRTTVSKTVTNSGSMQVVMDHTVGTSPIALVQYCQGTITFAQLLTSGGGSPPAGNTVVLAGWTLRGCGAIKTGPPFPEAGYAVFIQDPAGVWHEGEKYYYTSPQDPFWSATYAVNYTIGPYQLGHRFFYTSTPLYPQFSAREGKYSFHWFTTPTTRIVSSCGGYSFTGAAAGAENDVGTIIGNIGGSASILTAGQDAAKISNVICSGDNIDFSKPPDDIIDGCLKGFGTEVRANTSYSDPPGATTGGFSVSPPHNVTYNLNARKYGATAWPEARFLDACLTTQSYDVDGTPQTPYETYLVNGSYSLVGLNQSWENGKIKGNKVSNSTWTVEPVWAAALDPPLSTNDLSIGVYAYVTEDGGLKGLYAPLVVALAPTVQVHRPDSVKLSDFVSSNPAVLAVTEAASSTTFTATGEGASATRTLVTTWRNGITKTDPAFDYQACIRLKHNTSIEDVFYYGTYAYLTTVWESTVSRTLTLRLAGAAPVITDNHETGSSRYDAWTVDYVAWWAEYDVPVPAGGGTVTVDLLFPARASFGGAEQTGGPFYLGRVDSWKLSGFVAGTYVLTDAYLDSGRDDDGQYSVAYPKCGIGPPLQRGDYSVPMIAHNGSFALAYVPDTAEKQNENHQSYGGGHRHTDPVTGAGTGQILDAMKTVSTWGAELDGIEGIEVTYQEANSLAALSDGETTLPEPADWIHPDEGWNYHSLRPGDADAPWTPPVAITAHSIELCNAVGNHIDLDHWLMGAIEVLADDGGSRAPANVILQAYYMDGADEVLVSGATGTTDKYGFAVVAPIPANEARQYGVKQV